MFELSNIIMRHEVRVLPRSSRENKAAQHASKNLPTSQCWGLALSQVGNAFSQAVKLIFTIVLFKQYSTHGYRKTLHNFFDINDTLLQLYKVFTDVIKSQQHSGWNGCT